MQGIDGKNLTPIEFNSSKLLEKLLQSLSNRLNGQFSERQSFSFEFMIQGLKHNSN